ncbi:MAG: hypothetical protein ABEH61_00160 [Haloarculaceae archaeon]
MVAGPRTQTVVAQLKRLFVWLVALGVCAVTAWLAVPRLAEFPI